MSPTTRRPTPGWWKSRLESGADQGIEHASDGLQRLVPFTVGQHATDNTPGGVPRGGEGRLQLLEVEAGNGRVGDHTQVAAGDEGIQQLSISQQAGPILMG